MDNFLKQCGTCVRYIWGDYHTKPPEECRMCGNFHNKGFYKEPSQWKVKPGIRIRSMSDENRKTMKEFEVYAKLHIRDVFYADTEEEAIQQMRNGLDWTGELLNEDYSVECISD